MISPATRSWKTTLAGSVTALFLLAAPAYAAIDFTAVTWPTLTGGNGFTGTTNLWNGTNTAPQNIGSTSVAASTSLLFNFTGTPLGIHAGTGQNVIDSSVFTATQLPSGPSTLNGSWDLTNFTVTSGSITVSVAVLDATNSLVGTSLAATTITSGSNPGVVALSAVTIASGDHIEVTLSYNGGVVVTNTNNMILTSTLQFNN